MSTYLLVCIVGKFSFTEKYSQQGIRVRGYTPVGLESRVTKYVEIAAESVDFYSNYFGIPYPLQKLDLVSLHDLNVRAMENWGCITFLDSVFLSAPEDTSAEMFQRNARTVAHEVSHMWFGNLVTMKWWDDIWLNEGFARYAEHYILSHIRPEFYMWEKYNHKVFKVALECDK